MNVSQGLRKGLQGAVDAPQANDDIRARLVLEVSARYCGSIRLVERVAPEIIRGQYLDGISYNYNCFAYALDLHNCQAVLSHKAKQSSCRCFLCLGKA
jgi:hypothetical protein